MKVNENKFNIPIELLFDIAARENKKRAFLFVSRVIGKHIPIKPQVLNITGAILARLWALDRYSIKFNDVDVLIEGLKELLEDDIRDCVQATDKDKNKILKAVNAAERKITLGKRTLFIGFAETATGIAQAVFNSFENAECIHTTREEIAGINPNFVFKEEHSHAVNHMIYAPSKDYFSQFEEIVLIDDEITTGKTAVNLIKNLPGNNFGVLSILDWRTKEDMDNCKNITFSSLTKGTITCEKLSEVTGEASAKILSHSFNYKSVTLDYEEFYKGYVRATARFGIISDDNDGINNEMKKIASSLLKYRNGEKCLCLGEGEFIYLPCVIASYLGNNVYFHSTTRSPVYAQNKKGYGNRNKIELSSTNNNGIKYFLYNIPANFYEDVFYLSEKELKEDKKRELSNVFKTFGIDNIIFVSFVKEC